MNMKRLSRQTCRFLQPPGVISCAAVVGRLEGAGPLGGHFDAVAEDSFCGRKTWEQGEAQMQADALRLALQKGGLTAEDVDCEFAGDLLNQNIGATFALRDFHIPFYGVYGACSTMGETLALAAQNEQILTAECEMDVLGEIRSSINVFRDRRPELYQI